MFTQPCFIRKNTPDLRKKLEELGYYRHPSYGDNEYLYLNRGFYHTNVVGYSEEIERMIDCGVNEELFLALAALRYDNDYMQWFISDETKQFYKCTSNKFDFHQEGIANWLCCSSAEYFRKATVEEIIEHFNKK